MEAPGGFEPPMEILQTSAYHLATAPLFGVVRGKMEREKGFEPSTSTLARLHSTTELLPHLLLSEMEYSRTIIFLQQRLSNSIFLRTLPRFLLSVEECYRNAFVR